MKAKKVYIREDGYKSFATLQEAEYYDYTQECMLYDLPFMALGDWLLKHYKMRPNMKILPVTVYQCEDGQSFTTLQEAERHMDVLDMVRELEDETSCGSVYATRMAEWLYDKYEVTPISEPTLPAQD